MYTGFRAGDDRLETVGGFGSDVDRYEVAEAISVVGVVGNCGVAGVAGGVANTGALKNGLRILRFDILDKCSTSLQYRSGGRAQKQDRPAWSFCVRLCCLCCWNATKRASNMCADRHAEPGTTKGSRLKLDSGIGLCGKSLCRHIAGVIVEPARAIEQNNKGIS